MSASDRQRRRIVVGVDGSSASTAALRWAAAEAARHAARLEAVIAWRPAASMSPPGGHPQASARTLQERRADAEAVLDIALREVSSSGVEIERRVMRGSPHRVLLEAGDGATMLVIGGHAGKLSGKLPWSTGQHLVRDVRCPLVIVPRSRTGGAGAHEAGAPRRERATENTGGGAAGVAGAGLPPR
jgi:nucleotide-binding universal stress UspA family protein